MNKFFTKISLIIIFLFHDADAMLKCIKNTYYPLQVDYKHLSLVHGAIIWETGTLRRMYGLGQIYPEYALDKKNPNFKIVDYYKNTEDTHNTIRLIHLLFYRVPGSTGETDFGPTQQLNEALWQGNTLDLIKTVEVCARLTAQFEWLQRGPQNDINQILNDFKLYLTNQKKDVPPEAKKGERKKLEKHNTNIDRLYGLVDDARYEKKSFEQLKESKVFKDYFKAKQQEQIQHEKYLEKCDCNPTLDKLLMHFLIEQHKPLSCMQIIRGALWECDQNNPNALYLSHMPHMIVLAFVYTLCKENRAALRHFYNILNQELDGRVLSSGDLTQEWDSDVFTPPTSQQDALDKIKNILETDTSKPVEARIEQHIEEFVYYINQIKAYYPVGYATAYFTYQQGQPPVPFPDCMENAIRNFIGWLLYDKTTNRFNIQLLKDKLGHNLLEALEKFFTTYPSPDDAGSGPAHNAWTSVISNIPGVAYNNTTENFARRSNKGYLWIPDIENNQELRNKLIDYGYQLTPPGHYNYNLCVSIKNLILVLNHLFQLNLLPQSPEELAHELLRNDFVKHYFQPLCEKLNLNGFIVTQPNGDEDEKLNNPDEKDFAKNILYTTLKISDKSVSQFTTYDGHGEFSVIKSDSSEENKLKMLLRRNTPDFSGSMRSVSFEYSRILLKEFDLKIPKLLYSNLFAHIIDNPDYEYQCFTYVKERLHGYGFLVNLDIIKLLLRCAERQPDENQKNLAIQRVFTLFSTFDANDFKEKILSDLIDEQMDKLKKMIMSFDDRQEGLYLLATLINANIEKIFQTAFELLINSKAPKTSGGYVMVITALVDKKFEPSFDTALDCAKTVLKSGFPKQAFSLSKSLLEANKYDQEFIRLLLNPLTLEANSFYPSVKAKALRIFIILVEKNIADSFDKALEAFKKTEIAERDNEVLNERNKLKVALIKAGVKF